MKSSIGKVSLDKLTIDHRVQRSQLNKTKLNKIVANFDKDALGVFILSKRPNSFIVLDGWHRNEACKLVPDAPAEVDAIIFEGLTLAQEARLFQLFNTRSEVNAVDQFKSEVLQGLEEAVRINTLVEGYGLQVSVGGGFGAINTAKRIVRRPQGFERLEMAFKVLDASFTADSDSFDGRLVEAIAEMAYHYGGMGITLDVDGFIKRLSEYEGGVDRIIREAKGFNEAAATKRALAGFVVVLTKIYNKGRREQSLLPPYQRAARLKKEPLVAIPAA